MGNTDLIIAIDQGTSATKALAIDTTGAVVTRASAPVAASYPNPGWVEQDAAAIWTSVREAVAGCLDQVPGAPVVALALCNQRESMLLWDRRTGEPVAPMLSWQDGRTSEIVARRHTPKTAAWVRARSGLPMDPMFSAAKGCWLLDHHDPDRKRSRAGQVCLGTIDTYLMNRLGAGAITEAGNASRTQLLDIRRATWDADLLRLFDVPLAAMPELVPSIGPRGDGAALHPRLAGVRVHAVLGDSHAALFGHGAFRPGDVKATLGTGSSVMALAAAPAAEQSGICSTIAWDLGAGPSWALEGNIRSAGATVKWLADVLQVTPDELARLASDHGEQVGGAVLVPAFGGLGAPWWDPHAVGLIAGITLGTSRADLMHAAIDSIAHQVVDVVEAMDRCVNGITRLRVDGGATRNLHLRALLAGYLGRPVVHLDEPDVSALGAGHMAGLSLGLWNLDGLGKLPRRVIESVLDLPTARIHARRQAWADGLRRSRLRGDSWK